MSYLILSHTHHLLPVAQRLRREGATVEWAPWRSRYSRAWQGTLDTALGPDARRTEETLQPLIDMAAAGELTVLHDGPRWSELFRGATDQWGTREPVGDLSPLRACGWWDGNDLHAPHLLVADLGAWPGGLGPRVEGGATLVRGWETLVRAAWEPYLDGLRASGHRGLVQAHLGQGATVLWWAGGWEPLHLHAFLAALGDEHLGKALQGEVPVLPWAYSVAVPVTTGPWPIACDQHSPEVPLDVPRELAAQASWHDFRVVEGKPMVAGLDGFVAVTKGTAATLGLARHKALAAAMAISTKVPAPQLRPDTGASVEGALASLERFGWVP